VAGDLPLLITACGTERAEDVHRLTQAAFAPYKNLDPPSSVGRESLADVARDLADGGGAIAELEGQVVGCLRWEPEESGEFYTKRVAVDPAVQSSGIGRALMTVAEGEAKRRGYQWMTVGVRLALPGNQQFFRSLGFEIVEENRHDGYDHTTWLKMRKELR
jgi:GNAT superfamily N-acetyltransferase